MSQVEISYLAKTVFHSAWKFPLPPLTPHSAARFSFFVHRPSSFVPLSFPLRGKMKITGKTNNHLLFILIYDRLLSTCSRRKWLNWKHSSLNCLRDSILNGYPLKGGSLYGQSRCTSRHISPSPPCRRRGAGEIYN